MIRFESVAIGVEVSQDRLHASIGVAGSVEGEEKTLIQLAGYLDGTASAVDEVLALVASLAAGAVVIDPHSQAATFIDPLEKAKLKGLLRPSTSDVVVAHGWFMDDLNAGKLRHVPHPRLDEAARAGTQRPLGGAKTWDRRGEVDVSPLTAVTLALWGLRTMRPARPPVVVL